MPGFLFTNYFMKKHYLGLSDPLTLCHWVRGFCYNKVEISNDASTTASVREF